MTEIIERTNQTSISTLLDNYFTINDVKHYLPLKLTGKNDKKGKPTYWGAMANFTSNDFISLKENDVVIRDGEKNYIKQIDYDKASAFELNISSLDKNICVIDIDGDNESLIDFKSIEDTEKQEWINKTIPEIFKSCPYTLSRTKKLPHYYFILDGADKNQMKSKVKITTDCLTFCLGDVIASHIWEKPDAVLFNFNGTLPTIHYDDIKPFLLEKVQKNITGKQNKKNLLKLLNLLLKMMMNMVMKLKNQLIKIIKIIII